MKQILLVLTSLIYFSAFAQVDYNHFENTWCKCIGNSGIKNSDTLRFMPKNLMDSSCKTNWYSEPLIYNESQHFSCADSNKLEIYEDGGSTLSSEYIPDSTLAQITKIDTIIDSFGKHTIDTTHSTLRVPIQIEPGGSAAIFYVSNYFLDIKINYLTVDHRGTKRYRVLLLTENELILLKQ